MDFCVWGVDFLLNACSFVYVALLWEGYFLLLFCEKGNICCSFVRRGIYKYVSIRVLLGKWLGELIIYYNSISLISVMVWMASGNTTFFSHCYMGDMSTIIYILCIQVSQAGSCVSGGWGLRGSWYGYFEDPHFFFIFYFFFPINYPISLLAPPSPSKYFTWALFVLLLSTLVCYQPTELIWAFLFHKLSHFTPPPPPVNVSLYIQKPFSMTE